MDGSLIGAPGCIRFHDFELYLGTHQLMRDGEPVALSEKALDVLLELVSKSGCLVSTQELRARLWPDALAEQPVDECLLWLEMAALRQALGPAKHLLRTLPGLGYIFDMSEPSHAGDAALLAGSRGACDPARDPRKRVIVIDDDEGNCQALRSLLRSAGLCVHCYGSVAQYVASNEPDLPGCLLLDVRLPGQSGLDFMEDLAKADVAVPVIIMTGHADAPMTVRAMKAGAIEFLIKPVLPQRLLNAVQFAIEAAPSHPRALRWVDHGETEERHERGGLAPWQETAGEGGDRQEPVGRHPGRRRRGGMRHVAGAFSPGRSSRAPVSRRING